MNNSGNTLKRPSITAAKIAYFLELMASRNLELHAVTIIHNRQIVFSEGCYPFRPDQLHPVFSCSKSFVSVAVGMLYDQKKLTLDDRLITYFPEYRSIADPDTSQVTLRQLLTMALGQNHEPVLHRDQDWVRGLLAKHQAWPAGDHFFYDSMCTYLLSAVITRITGQSTAQFLDEKLFDRLGIRNYYWEEDGMGRNTGGWGLHISTEDMARFGQFLADDGMVNGEVLLSKEWLRLATSMQIETAVHYPENRTENRQGYGYQFWLCSHGAFRASGLYGQLCLIWPEQNLVLAVTSAAGGSQPILDAFFTAIDSDELPPRLNSKPQLSGLRPADGIPVTPYIRAIIDEVNHRELTFLDNEFCLEQMSLDFHQDRQGHPLLSLKLSRSGGCYELLAAHQCWQPFDGNFHRFSPYDRLDYATDQVPGYQPGTSFASFAWLNECTLEITMRHTDQAARYLIRIYFDADCLTLEYQVTELQSDFTYARASACYSC